MVRGTAARIGNSSTTMSSRSTARSPSAACSSALIAGPSGVLENRPPSQYGSPSMSVIGKLGGRLPLAATCSKVRPPGRSRSKYSISPVPTFVAPTITRGSSALSRARVDELGERLSQRCGVVDAREQPGRGEQPGAQLVHARVAEQRQRPVDRCGQPEGPGRRGDRELGAPQRVEGGDRVGPCAAEHRGGDGADRHAGHRHRPEPRTLLVERPQHPVLVGAQRAAALQHDRRLHVLACGRHPLPLRSVFLTAGDGRNTGGDRASASPTEVSPARSGLPRPRPEVDARVDRVLVDPGQLGVVEVRASPARRGCRRAGRRCWRRSSTDVTRASRSAHASAICASVWPRACAISLSARTWASVLSLSRSGDSDDSRDAREPSGIPSRYLLVSMPWASGENAMQPTPVSPSTSSRSSSIQRLSIEYDGWWISSGVPSSRQDRARPPGCAPGVGGDAGVERLARRGRRCRARPSSPRAASSGSNRWL